MQAVRLLQLTFREEARDVTKKIKCQKVIEKVT